MSIVELALTSLAEATSTAMHREHDSQGFGQLQGDAREAGEVAGAARKDIETRLGRPVVTPENYKALMQPVQQLELLGGTDETSDQND
jgi:DNA-damage-inducible protein D